MDHVEECPSYYVDCWGTICDCDYEHICMCRELRACEERAREDERSNNFTPDDFSDAMTEAYQRGLNDAMEAVELIPAPYKVVGNFETYGAYHEGRSDMKDMALSAIDALRENYD